MGKRHYYKIIDEFNCCGKDMVTIRVDNNAHVMEYDEWKKIYGCNHQNRWKKKMIKIGS